MTINDLIQWGWHETWWTWNRPVHEAHTFQDIACHYFNLIEVAAWFTFAAQVLIRWTRFRRSPLELLYALAFLLFGISDLVESQRLTSWLLWWKVANLAVLFWLRKIMLTRYYPGQRLF